MPSAGEFGERARRLATVLADVTFPAMKWEILTHAEFIGADIRSRTELYRLPAGQYVDLASVIAAVASEQAAYGVDQ